MLAMTLQNLVLRGVSVGNGGLAIQARLGTGYRSNQQTPAPVSRRHPSSSKPETEPDRRHASADDRAAAADRAGRPGCLAGVPSCRGLARSASRAIAPRWHEMGGASLSAATIPGSLRAGTAAAAGKVPLGCSRTSARLMQRAAVGRFWFTPAGGASTASTRGKGAHR
jgi:hypothetical protein